MQYKIHLFSLVFFCLVPVTALAQSEEESEALETMLGKWESAWNDGSVEQMMKLYHPDNKVRRAYDLGGKPKESLTKFLSEIQNVFGTFDEYALGQYIDRKKCQVVKITYSKKGVVPGTWRLKKHEGAWLVEDFNIDGQGEPELDK